MNTLSVTRAFSALLSILIVVPAYASELLSDQSGMSASRPQAILLVANERASDLVTEYEVFEKNDENQPGSINTSLVKPATPYMELADASDIDCMIEPYKVIAVATAVEGLVKTVTVDRGDFIKKGQVLAKLESGIEKVTVDLSRARVKFNERNYARVNEVYEKEVISFHVKDEAETEKKLAELELRRSIEALRMRTIKSPLSGIVVERFISPGEFSEQQKIVKIAQIHPLNVEVIAPLSMLGTVEVGMEAIVYPEGPVAGPLKAKVKIVDRVIDAASGTFGVRLELPNPDHRISAGLKCRTRFLREQSL